MPITARVLSTPQMHRTNVFSIAVDGMGVAFAAAPAAQPKPAPAPPKKEVDPNVEQLCKNKVSPAA